MVGLRFRLRSDRRNESSSCLSTRARSVPRRRRHRSLLRQRRRRSRNSSRVPEHFVSLLPTIVYVGIGLLVDGEDGLLLGLSPFASVSVIGALDILFGDRYAGTVYSWVLLLDLPLFRQTTYADLEP